MKKRTLNQTWILCLRMWKWISEMKAKNPRRGVSTLKRQWLRENDIIINGGHDCFFCEYNNDNFDCSGCPGKLVNSYFSCSAPMYHYYKKPTVFYKELLRLNRIRKARK